MRTEGRTGAQHPCGPLVQYWGEGDGFPIGVGNDGGVEWKEGQGWQIGICVVQAGVLDPSRGIGMGRGMEWRVSSLYVNEIRL